MGTANLVHTLKAAANCAIAATLTRNGTTLVTLNQTSTASGDVSFSYSDSMAPESTLLTYVWSFVDNCNCPIPSSTKEVFLGTITWTPSTVSVGQTSVLTIVGAPNDNIVLTDGTDFIATTTNSSGNFSVTTGAATITNIGSKQWRQVANSAKTRLCNTTVTVVAAQTPPATGCIYLGTCSTSGTSVTQPLWYTGVPAGATVEYQERPISGGAWVTNFSSTPATNGAFSFFSFTGTQCPLAVLPASGLGTFGAPPTKEWRVTANGTQLLACAVSPIPTPAPTPTPAPAAACISATLGDQSLLTFSSINVTGAITYEIFSAATNTWSPPYSTNLPISLSAFSVSATAGGTEFSMVANASPWTKVRFYRNNVLATVCTSINAVSNSFGVQLKNLVYNPTLAQGNASTLVAYGTPSGCDYNFHVEALDGSGVVTGIEVLSTSFMTQAGLRSKEILLGAAGCKNAGNYRLKVPANPNCGSPSNYAGDFYYSVAPCASPGFVIASGLNQPNALILVKSAPVGATIEVILGTTVSQASIATGSNDAAFFSPSGFVPVGNSFYINGASSQLYIVRVNGVAVPYLG